MALHYIIGRAGSGKTEYCLEEIRQNLRQEPQGTPLIYLVPEQMTFQAEHELATTPGLGGMIRAQVFSFSRLAWKVLQEVGGLSRHHVNRTGIHMLLRKVIETSTAELKVFGRAAEQSGFIEQIEAMIAECKRHCISVEQVEQLYQQIKAEQAESQTVVVDKLHDLHILYQGLAAHVAGHYVDSEDYLQLLAEKINQSAYLQQAEIWIDGFHSYSPQELQVIKALLQQSRDVSITLTMDPTDSAQDLFYVTSNTYNSLKRIAHEAEITCSEPVMLNAEPPPRFGKSPLLAHLEQQLYRRPVVAYQPQVDQQVDWAVQEDQVKRITDAGELRIVAAAHRRSEIEGVAREMIRLVRDEGYRWRDLAVMVRNLPDYYELLHTIFADYQIPLFLDQKRSMLDHPLIELLRATLDVITQHWRYDAVFRCVKTDLLFPLDESRSMDQWREELDQLENYVLAYGIQGSYWTEGQAWTFRSQAVLEDEFGYSATEMEQQQRINYLKELISQPILEFHQGLRAARNGWEMCEQVFIYLEKLAIPQKIQLWREQAEAEGNLEQANEHGQVWQAVLELLDQMVELLGDQELSLDIFAKMVESGVESFTFAHVPPALDQVVVAAMDHSRLSKIKCLFVLGVNEGVIPAKPDRPGIFSEEERDALERCGLTLAPGIEYQLLEEPFTIYTACTSASRRLWISYPLADEEGKALLPSPLVQRIKEIFPGVREELLVEEPEDLPVDRLLAYLSTPARSLSTLVAQVRQWQRGYPISPLWWEVYNWFMVHPLWKQEAKALLASLFYQNHEAELQPQTSAALYGQKIQVSVSRLERFGACPFSQFVAHGLRLKERAVFRLEAPDIGQLFHAALKMFADYLRHQQLEWAALDKGACLEIAQEIIAELAPKIQSQIFLRSHRHTYIQQKLTEVVAQASLMLSKQARQSGFSPLALELAFGGKEATLPSLELSLASGYTLELIGRIDRVDQAQGSRGTFLRVIDYKSSQTSLNMTEVYHGLALQMLTYLDVLLSNATYLLGHEALPAGVLYFHVHHPFLTSAKPMGEAELEQEIFKKFKMKGLLLAEQEVAQLMDTQLQSGYSQVIPVALKKDGQFYASSSVVSQEQFTQVRGYVRRVIKEMGTQLTNGVIAIAPYKLKKKTPCLFCSYKSICQFDVTVADNQFRFLPTYSKEMLLQKIVEEGEGYDESSTGR